ncbi:MAG: CehA/McbA family metallohydrolase [Calditrichia bacterium]
MDTITQFLNGFLLALLFIPVFLYAEIHFRFPFLPSRLFKKEPEIVFDMPRRGRLGKSIPLFLFVKDADRFPAFLQKITVEIIPQNGAEIPHFELHLNQRESTAFRSQTFWIKPEYFPASGNYRLKADLLFRNSAGRLKRISQDNYRGIPHPPFAIHIAEEALPAGEGWVWGDLHTHSHYTSDQVEFGAPPLQTVQAARCQGLDFVAVTDHSYDLDDLPYNYLKNDPALSKWHQFQAEMRLTRRQVPEVILLAGEEVSAGNARGKNVHCLILNDPQFHPGSGDSAERLFHRKPDLSIAELLQRKNGAAVAIAAHPFEQPPLSQRLVLNRGIWEKKDISLQDLHALQILNGQVDSAFQQGKSIWISRLLQGVRIGIAAGTDSHGNFNCFRQINIPFWSMKYHHRQLLGSSRTAVFSREPNAAAILESLRNHRTIISTGPFLQIQLKSKSQISVIGDVHPAGESDELWIEGKSLPEFGDWQEIKIFYGIRDQGEEKEFPLPPAAGELNFSRTIKFGQPGADYIRAEGLTKKDQQEFICLTNPIWIKHFAI